MTGRDHPVLQAEGVAKSYGGRKILENVSISLGPEELVCLVGVSGAGKTTLFNILSGLERPDGGRVLLNGRDVTGAPGQVSYMLQRDLLLPHKKVLDNAALPLVIRGMKKREARAEAASYFPRFGLEGTEDKYPAQLSGGMRQRAALLRTFLGSRDRPRHRRGHPPLGSGLRALRPAGARRRGADNPSPQAPGPVLPGQRGIFGL